MAHVRFRESLWPPARSSCWLGTTSAALDTGKPERQAAGTNCVTLGTPKPTVSFTYRYSDTTVSSEYANRWEEMTATGSRMTTTRTGANAGQSTSVTLVVDDVVVLAGSTAAQALMAAARSTTR